MPSSALSDALLAKRERSVAGGKVQILVLRSKHQKIACSPDVYPQRMARSPFASLRDVIRTDIGWMNVAAYFETVCIAIALPAQCDISLSVYSNRVNESPRTTSASRTEDLVSTVYRWKNGQLQLPKIV